MTKRPKSRSATLYEMQAEICAALAHPVRLQILDLIGEGEKTSSELLAALCIPKTNISQHLSVLRDAGLIRSRREGLFQHLSLGLPKIREACAIVKAILSERMALEEKQHAALRKELRSKK